MWRAFFLACGVYACILGLECLAIDKAVVKMRSGSPGGAISSAPAAKRDIVPPEWAPWSLMSAGAVTMLYSFTIPKRVKD